MSLQIYRIRSRVARAVEASHFLVQFEGTWHIATAPLAAMHHLKHVDSAECHDAFMFLRHKEPKNRRGGHGDRADRQLLALRIGVHRMQ